MKTTRSFSGACAHWAWLCLVTALALAHHLGTADALSAQEPPEPRAVQPGAPGEPSHPLSLEELRSDPRPHTEADVRFMRNMIHHHHQALVMSALVPERAEREELKSLAARIERSQDDEIRLMKRWLRIRGEEVPELEDHRDLTPHTQHHGHHHHDDDPLMAGMLTPDQLERLSGARGEEFDRLFLEYMIFHHEGAIDMVDELLASPGAAQDAQLFDFASHVEADQTAEIQRMRALLRSGG